jgi:ABC-2 type transport system permease protein
MTVKGLLTAYLELARVQARTVLAYRSDYLVGLLGVILQVFLFRVVWTAVYADRGEVAGIELGTQIAYTTLVAVQYWVFNPWGVYQIPQRVYEGKIAVDLARPVGFIQQVMAGQAGATAATVPFALVALPLAILVGGAVPPASVAAGLIYVASLLLAYVIIAMLAILVGLTAFWTLEIGGMFMIFRMVSQFFAGALVPLWFMPGWLRSVADVLPFQATTYTPLAIYLGQIDGVEARSALGVQVLWIVVLAVALRLTWTRAVRRVVVLGG